MTFRTVVRAMVVGSLACAASGCALVADLSQFNGDVTASDAGGGSGGFDSSASSDSTVDAADARATNDGPVDRLDGMPEAPTLGASDGGPVNYIVNPNFASSTLAGWTVVPPTAEQTDAFTQAPIGTSTTPQGQTYELATYSMNDAFTVDISQALTNLPDGTYTFGGWFNRGTDNQAYIYAKNCGGAADGGAATVVDIPLTSSTGWKQVTIPGIVVASGSCQVGFYVDASATDWLNADGFTFESDDLSAADAGGDPDDAGAD